MSISSTLIQGADVRFQEADAALRSHVGCFWVISAAQGAVVRAVPDGSTAIYIQLEKGLPAEWCLRGPLLRPSERRFESEACIVGVRLRPAVTHLLTGIRADSLVDRRIALSRIASFRRTLSSQRSQRTITTSDLCVLSELCVPRRSSPAEYIAALERVLVDRLKDAAVHDVVAAAIREIEREHGSVPVGDVADRCGVSVRHLNRLMRVWVGYGAKRFATVIRFQATLHQMEQSPRPSPASLASDNGYFDQSHLSADVARFAGATPGQLSSTAVADFSKTRCDDLP